MLFWLLCLVAHRLLGTRERAHDRRGVEILVLRHQLSVLRRQVNRPKLTRLDRLLLAAASQRLPGSLWSSFIVRPETLLRWHRELVRRKWTFRMRGEGGSARSAPRDH
jgi:putative transposase